MSRDLLGTDTRSYSIDGNADRLFGPIERFVEYLPQLFCNCACRLAKTASEIFRVHGCCVSNKESYRSGLQPSVLVFDVPGAAPQAGMGSGLWPSKISCLRNLDVFGPQKHLV